MRRAWIVSAALVALALTAGSAQASFPGRNGAIAYGWTGKSAFRAGPTHTSIRAVDPRTGRVRVLRDCPLRVNESVPYTDCSVSAPRYSPDGRRIAFPTIRITPDFMGRPWLFQPGIARMAWDGTGLEEHPVAHTYWDLAWAPAADRLLLVREQGVFLASLDGAELSQALPAPSQAPDWSSRAEIAFERDEDIFVTRLGGSPRRLTYRGGSNPSWSPHGTKLAFVRQVRNGRANVYLVRRDGRGLRRLTRAGAYNPVWSPNGKWIAFVRDGDLYVIRTSGRGRRRLVDAPAESGEGPQVGSVDWQARVR
jgi:TolB protein